MAGMIRLTVQDYIATVVMGRPPEIEWIQDAFRK